MLPHRMPELVESGQGSVSVFVCVVFWMGYSEFTQVCQRNFRAAEYSGTNTKARQQEMMENMFFPRCTEGEHSVPGW